MSHTKRLTSIIPPPARKTSRPTFPTPSRVAPHASSRLHAFFTSGRLHLPALRRRHDGDVSRFRHSRVQAIRRFRRLADHQAGRAAARLTRKPSQPRLPLLLGKRTGGTGLGTAQVSPASTARHRHSGVGRGELLTPPPLVFFPLQSLDQASRETFRLGPRPAS